MSPKWSAPESAPTEQNLWLKMQDFAPTEPNSWSVVPVPGYSVQVTNLTSINGAGVIVDIELYDHTGQKVPCGQAAYLSQNILPGQAQAYPRANPPSLQQGQEYTLKVGVFKSPPNPGDSWGQLLYWNNQVELFIA